MMLRVLAVVWDTVVDEYRPIQAVGLEVEAQAQVHVTCPLAIISVGGHVTGQKMHTATFNLPQPKPMAVPRHTIKRQELNHEIVTWGALLGMPARWMPPRIFDHRDTTY
jgi:hypothetical protein